MIPLHIHSVYSLLSGVITIDEIIEYAKKYRLSSIALTDTNGMYGLIQFAKKSHEAGIKPILGSLIDQPGDNTKYAIFLAKNNDGYSELCKLITARKLNDDFSLIKIINNSSNNLFIITPSIEILSSVKKKNIYAELIISPNQKKSTRKVYEYSNANNIKYVATKPVYFAEAGDHSLHKIVTAIRLNETIENLLPDQLVDEEYYFDDPIKLEEKLSDLPEALRNSEYIAENCNVNLKFNEYKFASFNIPGNQTSDSYLWEITHSGLNERYKPLTKEALNRLRRELKVISEMNFSNYFLIVWDLIREAKQRGMLFIGRGSAANSIVSYCLGLTQVDPIKHNLYFERFLNRGRTNPPDIDIDFSWRERDEIVKYVFDKYGYQNVAMISTTITFKARSAFREVAKANGLTNEEISKYSKYIPWTDARNLKNLTGMFPEARKLNFKIEPWKSIIENASRIANFPRHLSIHPSGIIITPEPVTNYTALEYAKNKGLGLIITQPDMYSIEDLGLVKIDILSQRSLGVLRDTLSRIDNTAKYHN